MDGISAASAVKVLEGFWKILNSLKDHAEIQKKRKFDLIEEILKAVDITKEYLLLSNEEIAQRVGHDQYSASSGFILEKDLAHMWRFISYKTREYNQDLSERLFVKGLLWSDERQRRMSRTYFVISLEEVVMQTIKLHPKFHNDKNFTGLLKSQHQQLRSIIADGT
jgi:hypothetical protein